MDEKKVLLEEIKKCRNKMNLGKMIDCGILSAAAGGILGMFCELASLFWQFYYVHLAAGLCFAGGLMAGVGYALYKRADMKQAAGRLDSFGLKERMVTAYEQIAEGGALAADGRKISAKKVFSMEEEHPMEEEPSMEKVSSMEKLNSMESEFVRMQRQDALLHYRQVQGQIKIPILPERKHVLALLLSAAVVIGMSFIPSQVRDRAQIRHQVQEQAEEELKTLEEFLDALEGVDVESLTEEQRTQLKELQETMKLSQEELANVNSWESLASALEKLDYKYGQAGQSLESLAGQMQNPGAAGIASAEALAKAAANQTGQQLASSGTASSGTTGDNSGEGSGEKSDGDGNGSENGDGNGSGDGGGSGDGNGSGNGDGSGDGNDSGDGGESGDGNGSGNGDGSGDGNGSGDGGGSGDGNGSGNGDGNGSGSGNGSGIGGGRGTGSSSAAHDYVSIPNGVGNDSSLTGDKNGDQDSEYYRQQNGLAWEGNHVDYNSVLREYMDNAYEGIANNRYPSGMEPVIRNYFESLNQ